eukprot:4702-Pelagococcus_subviridis.AAC.2
MSKISTKCGRGVESPEAPGGGWWSTRTSASHPIVRSGRRLPPRRRVVEYDVVAPGSPDSSMRRTSEDFPHPVSPTTATRTFGTRSGASDDDIVRGASRAAQ